MTTQASVTVHPSSGVNVAVVSGQIDLSNAHVVYAGIQAALEEQPSALVLDLSETTYLDSAGVQLLFRVVRNAATVSVPVRLVVPEASLLRRVLDISDLPAAVPVARTEDEALGSLGSAAI